jgi:hypothetical protein
MLYTIYPSLLSLAFAPLPLILLLPLIIVQILQSLVRIHIPFKLYVLHPLLREVEAVCCCSCGSYDCGEEERGSEYAEEGDVGEVAQPGRYYETPLFLGVC